MPIFDAQTWLLTTIDEQNRNFEIEKLKINEEKITGRIVRSGTDGFL